MERESGTAPLKETGMEEEAETGLRSLGNWGQGEELGLVRNKERRDNRGRDRQRVRLGKKQTKRQHQNFAKS